MLQRQRGLTMISWLVVLMVIGFFIMVGLRVVPVYLEHYSVKNVLKSLEEEPFISRKPVSEIRKILVKRFGINNVRSINRDHIKIRRSAGITTIELNYEQRRSIAGNMDVIMTFSESLELVAN